MEAYRRVLEQVLHRYIDEDLVSATDSPYRVPRFLLNDVVRYWRTVAVDFAHKRRARRGTGWALRTVKLRLSRKLMYAAGLLSCYSCRLELASPERPSRGPADVHRVVEHLVARVGTTPLDIMARTVLSYFGELSGAGRQLFSAYDDFLAMLDDEVTRGHLESLRPRESDADERYSRAREIGTRFQDALTEIFLVRDTPVRDLTIRYGVF